MEKCKDKWQKITLQLNCIFGKWEQSSQGDDGFLEQSHGENVLFGMGEEDIHREVNTSNAVFGVLTSSSQLVLEQHKNFVHGKSTYLLYLWEMLDHRDLFSSSIQCLGNDVAAENGSFAVPSVVK